jgi:hypothetical protein
MDSSFVKPLASGAAAIAIDRFVLKQTDMKKNAIFGASVAIGSYGGSIVAPMVPKSLPDFLPMVDSTTLVGRALEIGLSSVAGWVINSKIMKNEPYGDDMYKRIAAIAAADFIGEYAADYFGNRPLSYLA